jgi:glycosyltransferase involved in cell wall biosynthesis
MNLYQVGNNPLHSYMYKSILDYSGIVTFHDVYIYHFIHAVFALSENPRRFWEEVAYCEGPEVARKAQIDYVKGQLDDYSLSLNKRLVQASRGIVTHSEWAAHQVRQKGNAPPIRVIPFGMFILDDDGGRFGRLVRRLLGLPENAFIFGIFGNIHRVKRMAVVLRAFARMHEQFSDTALFIVGPVDASAVGDLHPFQTSSESARTQGIYVDLNQVGYDRMLAAMQAVDAAINLRYPTAGETSGTLGMLLGQGKPTIVSAIGSFTEYPDLCCPKVPIDGSEEDVLYKQMIGLANDRSRYRRAVQAAYAFSQKRTWSFCAQQYVDFVEMLLSNHNS